MNQTLTARHKKLLFRAWHRGTREADLLVGRFAEQYLPHFSEDQLDLFEELLDENDPDIFDWVTGKAALPVLPIQPLIMQMIEFYKVPERAPE
ncbi:MAG: succinate dehydrogenase assembly factor 2 [Alphaproteobacteria bacterium]|nr:succinate dehydrogenase assembly factor 2 [Alphaproteobacteria bacterium]